MGRRKILKSDCEGCYDNFYNGNNDLGVIECMRFSTGKMIVQKKIHINDVPPWKNNLVLGVPNCYHVSGYVFVDPEREY